MHREAPKDTLSLTSAEPPQVRDSIYGAICGTVKDGMKQPLINALLQAYQNKELKGVALSDCDGSYSINHLSPGSYDLLATSAHYDSTMVMKIIVPAGKSVTLNVSTEKTIWTESFPVIIMCEIGGGYDWSSNREIEVKAEVFGRITDKHGRSLEEAEIQVYRDGKLKAKRYTNSNGDYDITKLEPGVYELRIEHDNSEPLIVKDINLAGGRQSKDLIMTRAPGPLTNGQ